MSENDPTVSLRPDTIKKIAEAVKPHTEPRKNVKADSKGRLTGAKPTVRYLRREDPDGTITYVPEVPTKYDHVRDVSVSQFQDFFGVHPDFVSADEGIQVAMNLGYEDCLPHGVVVTQFGVDDKGDYLTVGDERIRVRTLIRIKKDRK